MNIRTAFRTTWVARPLFNFSGAVLCASLLLAHDDSEATTWTAPAQSSAHDEAWTQQANNLLADIVSDEGRVNYAVARNQRVILDTLIVGLASPRHFDNPSAELAFYINAYNLLVIQGVVEAWPVDSVRDIKRFFKRRDHNVNGQQVSLAAIENNRVRRLGDARIHAALVCGAASCPPLLRGLFAARALNAQFDAVTARWLADPDKNTAREGELWISRIFKWYGEDFDREPYDGLVDFLDRHTPALTPIASLLQRNRSPRVRYQTYDWSLNITPREDD